MNGKIIILLFIINVLSLAQKHSATIKGKVVDETSKKGIQLANLFLLRQTDSAFISGEASLKDGSFQIKNVPEGEYILKITSIGYNTRFVQSILIDKKIKSKELQIIELKPSIVNLDEVLVSSKKETFNNSIDRKVYNIEKDIMSKSGTASELLQNIPSVQVDIDGNITLRGAGNAVIMINGKTSPLLAKSASSVLEQMPANSIEKIEVITNPSAKFKPDGNSGIINIVLKKNSNLGLNGNITGNAGAKSRYNGNISLNYNPGPINLYGSYGFRQDDRSRYNTDNRQLNSADSGSVYYFDKSRGGGRPFFQMTSGGIDFFINPSDKLGANFNYMYHNFTRDEVTSKSTLNKNLTLIEDYDRVRTETQNEKEFEAVINYQHNFSDEDHVFKAEFMYSYSPELENNKYTNIFRVPNRVSAFEKSAIYQSGLLKNIEIEYSNPLSETLKLEAGYAGEFDTPEFSYKGEYYSDVLNTYIKDFAKTNHYVMDEQINALYATLGNSYGSFGVLAGLRIENSYVKSHLINNDSAIVNKLFNLFPTLHLSYKFDETSSLQLNYSKRVNRPEGDQLNPFPEYQDPRNIRVGNPNLLPEFYHSIELGYQKEYEHYTFLQSVYYKYTNNKFTSIIKPLNDSVFLSTIQNLSSDQSAGLEFIFSANHNGLLSTNLSANIFYTEIDAQNIGYSGRKSTVAWSGSWNMNFNASKTTLFQLNSNYRSVRLTPQGEYNASYVVNIGCRQDLFDEKLSLMFTISDIFNSLKRKMELDTKLLKQSTLNERDSRIFYLGFTYHFGGGNKKSNERKLEYDNKL